MATMLAHITPAIAHGAGTIEYDIEPIVHGGSKLAADIESRAKNLSQALHQTRLRPNKRTAFEDAFEQHEGPVLFLASMKRSRSSGGEANADGSPRSEASLRRGGRSESEADRSDAEAHFGRASRAGEAAAFGGGAEVASSSRLTRPKPALLKLNCPVQPYAWGIPGSASRVGTLKAATDPSFALDEATPYAELWMGTHPNGPALIVDGAAAPPRPPAAADDHRNGNGAAAAAPAAPGELGDWLREHADAVGEGYRELAAKEGSLPYLFKVAKQHNTATRPTTARDRATDRRGRTDRRRRNGARDARRCGDDVSPAPSARPLERSARRRTTKRNDGRVSPLCATTLSFGHIYML